MSANNVRKLEALLSRVRERRAQPRILRVAAAAAAAPMGEPAEPLSLPLEGAEGSALDEARAFAASHTSPASREPAPLSFAPPHSSSPAPGNSDDLSDESFGDLNFDSAPAPAAAAVDGQLRSITLPDALPPVTMDEPESRIEHRVPQATGPVARSEGQAPPRAALSFEQLIARSLSLRPRDS